MKQLFTFVLAAMAFVACTQNEVEELTANRADAPETLTVGFEGGDTRIELNEVLKTVWTEGDEVSVFYKTLTNIRGTFQGKTGDRQGNILLPQTEFGDAVMDEYVVIYPYNEDYLLNAEALTLNAPIPATQSYKEGSYGENGNIMADASDATHVTLRSIYGWLRVHLTGDGEIAESITLRGNNGEQLAGYAQIDLNDYSVRFVSESSEPENDMEVGGDLVFEDELITEITLDCGEGVELGSEAKEFYIALPPQTFAEGMTIEVNCAGYKPMTLSTESSITIERNHIVPMEAVEHDAGVILPIWYTATALVEPYDATAFNVAIVSNEWDETTGEGVITFDGELTTIGDSAFRGRYSLTSVTIPDSVTTIGYGAFEYCSNLAEFKGKFAADGGRCLIKDNTIIAYAEASGTIYTIPDGVTTIGGYAFSDCESLTSVTIPDSVTTIGNGAFYDCGLRSVTIGDSVTTIGERAFYWCSSLTSVTIPDSVTTIGGSAFRDCSSLTSVTIPDSVTTIGDAAFTSCDSLAEFNGKFAEDGGRCLIIDGVLNAFALGCGVTEYTIPDSVTTIGNQAFEYCDSLTSVTIPDSVTTIGNNAFDWCYSLTNVTIGDGVTTIGGEAFNGCDSLTSVTIGDSVTTIGSSAFYYCDSLTSVYIADVAAWCNISFGSAGSNPLSEGVDLYLNNELVTDLTIPDSVTTIGDWAFYSCSSLTSVTIGNSVTTIGGYAFSDCRSLTSVVIPESVTTIGEGAFKHCDSLTSVTIPDSVTTIGNSAFYDCNSLTSVTIPDSVTTIGYSAFLSCSSLTSVYCKATTPPTLGGSSVFYYNKSGRKIYVPAESVEAYKAAENWNMYAADIVGYDFETGEVVE